MAIRTLNDQQDAIPTVTPLRKRRIVYTDFHKDMTVNPLSSDLALKTNEESIKEALKNLILTDRGERLFQPNLGSNIRASLFENATPAAIKILEERVREVINNFEPRVSLIDVIVFPLTDQNQVKITINFYIKSSELPLSTTVFIERAR